MYIGKAAHNILKAASSYVPNGHAFASPRFIAHKKPVDIGPFHITPYLVDHSAFDAYALLVESDGRRVFYSGDFRAHGGKAGLHAHIKDVNQYLSNPDNVEQLKEDMVAVFNQKKDLELIDCDKEKDLRSFTVEDASHVA